MRKHKEFLPIQTDSVGGGFVRPARIVAAPQSSTAAGALVPTAAMWPIGVLSGPLCGSIWIPDSSNLISSVNAEGR